jgi:hypothetical protein
MSENSTSQCNDVGSDSSVSTATCCGLDCPWIESRLGQIFRSLYAGPGAHPIPYKMDTVCLAGGPAGDVNHPP